jgi:hypothetical protein
MKVVPFQGLNAVSGEPWAIQELRLWEGPIVNPHLRVLCDI